MHGTHSLPDFEEVPAGHKRGAVRSAFGTDPASTVVQCEAPAAAMLPSAQGVQAAAPAAEKVPPGHNLAAVWSALEMNPASTKVQ